MTEVHSWQNRSDARAVVQQAVAALQAGQLVAFPTDTAYVLAADVRLPEAVLRLQRQERADDAPLALAVGGPAHAATVLPSLGPLARRLARRCWPGPVTLLHGNHATDIPDSLAAGRDPQGRLWVCSPAHSALLHALQQLGGPLLLATPRALAGQQVELTNLGDAVALAIDDGPALYPEGATRVAVHGDRWEVIREGIIPAEQIRVQLATVVVFVCTGNTCRSPMAEALCKRRLAERLGCSIDDLPLRGFLVISAGVSAYPGDPAAEYALQIVAERGADLADHVSRRLNPELVVQADQLVCMTRSHRNAVLDLFPHRGCEPRLLSPQGHDLADPVGQDETVYRQCAERIWIDLDGLVRELLPEGEQVP